MCPQRWVAVAFHSASHKVAASAIENRPKSKLFRESLNNRSFSCQRLPTAAGMHDPRVFEPTLVLVSVGFRGFRQTPG